MPILARVCLASLLFLLVPAMDVLSQPANGSKAAKEHLQSARETVSIQEAEQLIDLLEGSLGSLAEEDRRERIIEGVTSIVAAGLTSIVLVEGSDQGRPCSCSWCCGSGADD